MTVLSSSRTSDRSGTPTKASSRDTAAAPGPPSPLPSSSFASGRHTALPRLTMASRLPTSTRLRLSPISTLRRISARLRRISALRQISTLRRISVLRDRQISGSGSLHRCRLRHTASDLRWYLTIFSRITLRWNIGRSCTITYLSMFWTGSGGREG